MEANNCFLQYNLAYLNMISTHYVFYSHQWSCLSIVSIILWPITPSGSSHSDRIVLQSRCTKVEYLNTQHWLCLKMEDAWGMGRTTFLPFWYFIFPPNQKCIDFLFQLFQAKQRRYFNQIECWELIRGFLTTL